MEDQIRQQLDNPHALESLYRRNTAAFTAAFDRIFAELEHHPTARVWQQRLHYRPAQLSNAPSGWWLLALGAICSWFIARWPALSDIQADLYYPRNLSLVAFPALIAYAGWRNNLSPRQWMVVIVAVLASTVYINNLPVLKDSQTVLLACLHLPLFLWGIYGLAYTGSGVVEAQSRIGFLRHNGDMVVMMTILGLSWMLFFSLSAGLFSATGIEVPEYWVEHVVVFGLAAIPIAAAFLVQENPTLVSRVSPVIARVFAPLALLLMVVYLVAVVLSGKNLFTDREFLLVFNALLLGVMALILFSVADMSGSEAPSRSRKALLFGLSAMAIVLNAVALSAILFRISEWGFTPNRLAVLGSNALMLGHMALLCRGLYRTVRFGTGLEETERTTAAYLPVYLLWVGGVVFLLPFLFGWG